MSQSPKPGLVYLSKAGIRDSGDHHILAPVPTTNPDTPWIRAAFTLLGEREKRIGVGMANATTATLRDYLRYICCITSEELRGIHIAGRNATIV